MKLPNADRAIVDIAKLRDYCLNPMHPEGEHKARVFRSALGFAQEDAERLRQMILNALLTGEAVEQSATPYGRRFILDFDAAGLHASVIVRTAWMVRNTEVIPRLTSCYVL
jgi:hypothetical protein